MNLSDFTIQVLKNFSTINPAVVLRPGTFQKTMSADKNILVEATIPEDIPQEFGIYDLPQFLGNITTLENPELTFANEIVTIADNDVTIEYHACSPTLITSPPNKELELPQVDAKFTLTASSLQKIVRLAGMNNLPMFTVFGEATGLYLKVHDDTDTTNIAKMRIKDYDGSPFACKFKVENLKMISDTYVVQVAFGTFATFVNEAGTIKYYIALQSK